jgi:hypothetical protein
MSGSRLSRLNEALRAPIHMKIRNKANPTSPISHSISRKMSWGWSSSVSMPLYITGKLFRPWPTQGALSQ